ncbi:MAG: DUF2971 domain-containing protein, partial [Verrucomicrobiota bacterium]
MNPSVTDSLSGAIVSPLVTQGFSPEEDCSKIDVLRYLPLDRFLSLLELAAMWFSRFGALQDKFECTNPEGARAFVLKLAEDREAVEKCKSIGLWEHMVATAEHGRTGDDGRNMFVVNCWFIGRLESVDMWKKYGDEGKGIAIRSTVKQLAATFQIPDGYRLVSRVGRIKYVDFKSHKLGDKAPDLTNIAFIKDKTFETENEVRIVTPNNFHSGCLNPDGSQAGYAGS